ncbi:MULTISPECIES: acyl-CoA dehydrogenase family protein [Actinoplanes]|uniref:acyl-CoA dehydrogenase family protein n=1 Tax=Actinoplanes TaxID=1865 RepID=UPI0005F28D87|nr:MULTISPECIES: acyl-CoA dehydrogenase family protein [Actinoplanes]GLY00463.1 acyl-CoA dehydrogenase [Actinoplanes sp. NBRC 101535]
MTSTTSTGTRLDPVRRATATVPLLREHALWGEQNRRLHDEVLAALGDAGIYRMRVATRYGGLEVDATTLLRTVVEVGRGDGSAAWLTSVWSICAWLAGLFPDHVQDEVFADPDTRVCGVLSPTATAVPASGGIVVDGRWQFISGARHSAWQLVLAMAPTPDGAAQWPVMALIPLSELEIVDDWFTAGLRGTGSVATVAREVFVPADRVLPMPAILQGQYASAANAASPVFQAPMIATGCVSFAGTAVGLAYAARENFLERMPTRKITYTDYAAQRDAPITHLQLAEATLKAEEAEFHAARLAAKVDERATTGEPWTLLDRVGARAALGRVFQLAKESVDVLTTASGGSSIYETVPIQRAARDIQTLNLHALMHPNTNYELYGRVLCGLEPNTMYL